MGRPKRKTLKPTKIPTRTQEADTRAQGANDALELRGRIDDLTRLVSDWVWESDRDFRLTYVSEKVMEVLGFLPLELVGKSLLDLGTFPTREGESADFNWRSPFRDVPFETRDRDGNQRMFLISGLPVYDPETGDFIGVRGIAENVTERVLGAEALQRSEERFRRMFEDTAAGMMLVNLDGWLRQVNPALCKMLGYAEDEMLGLTFFDITHPDDQEDTRKFKEALISGEGRSHHLETRYRRKDGEMLWGQVTGSLIRDAGGGPHYILGQLVDITERKRAEEALRESEETLRSIIETTSEGYIETDPEAGIIEINNSFCAMLGYQRQELLGQSVFSLLDEENAKILKVQLRKRRRQIHRTYDINFMTKDGRKLTTTIHATTLYDQSGEVTGGFAFVSDITERKRAEAMLQASESRLRAVMDNSPAVIYLKDLDGRYLLVNREFENRHGLSSEEALGKTARQIFSKELADIVSGIDKELVEKGVKLEYAAERILSDGITRSLAIVKFPVRGPDESILGIGGVSIDVTEHKKAEEALRESEERLRAVVNNSPAIIHLKDTEGRFLLVNGRFEEFFAWSAGDVLGRTARELFGKEMSDIYEDHDREVAETRSVKVREVATRHPDGTTRTLLSVKFPVFGPDGENAGVGTVATDITERKAAEEARRESEARFRAFAESASDRFWEMDETFRFTFNSGAPGAKFQPRPEEIIGKTRWGMYGIDPDRDDHWRRHKEDLEKPPPVSRFSSFLRR